jgi:hypothetical protein
MSNLSFAIFGAFRFVREFLSEFFAVDFPDDIELVGSLRSSFIEGFDIHEHLMSGEQRLGPRIFHGAITVAVEIGILSEMVEAVAGSIEASSDEMTAIVIATTVGFASLRLIAARSLRRNGQR